MRSQHLSTEDFLSAEERLVDICYKDETYLRSVDMSFEQIEIA